MAINKVQLTVSQLISELNEGFTWLKRDDLGYGSIEEKYNANEKQIAAIRKHPALKDVETTITIFDIIDDTKSYENIKIETKSSSTDNSITKESLSPRTDEISPRNVVPMEYKHSEVDSTSAAEAFNLI